MSDPAEAKAAGAAHAEAAAPATDIRSLHGAAVEALRSGKIQQGIEGLTKVVALGKSVWLALASTGDWRYLAKRNDSPWYRSMRIFRQTRFGDWDAVFRNIAAALEVRDGLAGGQPR